MGACTLGPVLSEVQVDPIPDEGSRAPPLCWKLATNHGEDAASSNSMWDRQGVLPDNDLHPAKGIERGPAFDGTNWYSMSALLD